MTEVGEELGKLPERLITASFRSLRREFAVFARDGGRWFTPPAELEDTPALPEGDPGEGHQLDGPARHQTGARRNWRSSIQEVKLPL